jgi:hypothetical protein
MEVRTHAKAQRLGGLLDVARAQEQLGGQLLNRPKETLARSIGSGLALPVDEHVGTCEPRELLFQGSRRRR